MDAATFARCIARIRRRVPEWDAPVSRLTALRGSDPFRIAVGTILSARTRDDILAKVLERLWPLVRAPEDVLALPLRRLETILRPTGFYRTKARALKGFARTVIERHGGRVPDSMEELVELPGVGIKVAAIVFVDAFGKSAISVDTHVHRIANRLGVVDTATPEKTCRALTALLPRRLWRHVNANLVALGQTICLPRRPHCERCPVEALCEKRGVDVQLSPASRRGGRGRPSRR
jgi:endonuclease III